jgi:hypothetical protein
MVLRRSEEQKDCTPELLAHMTQLLRYISEVLHTIGKQIATGTVWYDGDCAYARAGGCRGGAVPPESLSLHYKGFTKGVTGSHMCWADRHCWISQRKVNVRL